MAKKQIYILTENGQIKKATYFIDIADQWVNLGDTFDYVTIIPDEDTPAEKKTPSVRESISDQQRILDQTLRDSRRVQEKAERVKKQFQSSLLR